MLQAIIDFFKNIFSSFSGNKKETTSPSTLDENKTESKVEIPTTEDALPEIVDVEPQDGAEVSDDDSEVILVNAEIEEEEATEDKDGQNNEPTSETNTTNEPITEPPSKKHEPRFLWILDNGHGKKTKGKRSPKWNDGKQVLEYELNRAIVKEIMKALDEKGVQYHNLVPEVNVGNILKTRVARANALKAKSKLPSIYVSIHSNAGPEDSDGWTTAEGIETWYYRNSLSGRKIAKIFQKHLISKTGWVNRDVRTGMNFYVLKNTSMSAILTENGFFNNKTEGRSLLNQETRQILADAHVEAIMEIEIHGIDGMKN